MSRRRIAIWSVLLGGVYGSLVVGIIVRRVDLESRSEILYVPSNWIWFLPVAAAFAAFLVSYTIDSEYFGPEEGIVAGALSYLALSGIHGALAAFATALGDSWNQSGSVFTTVIGIDLVFGGLSFGWMAPLIGMCAGAAYRNAYGPAI